MEKDIGRITDPSQENGHPWGDNSSYFVEI
jgi:hypothetical protein